MTSPTQPRPATTSADDAHDRRSRGDQVPGARPRAGSGWPPSCRSRLPGHRFTGEGANRLPDAHHYVTTIYFDTPSRGAVPRRRRRAWTTTSRFAPRSTTTCIRRWRRSRPIPAQIVRYQPWLWFEIKRRDGSRTRSSASACPSATWRCSSPRGGSRPRRWRSRRRGREPARRRCEIVSARSASRCRAVCLVNYRRLSWQSDEGDLRVTLDRGLASFAPPADLWARRQALVRSALGAARARGAERRAGDQAPRRRCPPGSATCSRGVGATPVPFSKFVAALRAVQAHG